MNYDDMRKAERAYRRDFPSPPSRREREEALQADFAKASGPASGSGALLREAKQLASRKKWLWAKWLPCPKCGSEGVTLRDWICFPSVWKCLKCRCWFKYEPGPKDVPIIAPEHLKPQNGAGCAAAPLEGRAAPAGGSL